MNKLLVAFSLLLAGGFLYYYNSTAGAAAPLRIPGLVKTPATYKPAAAQLTAIKNSIRSNHFNPDRVFMIDMHRASSQNRFFVYDLKQDTILASGLVTHGRCGEKWLEGRRYSNEAGSMCTSLGNYRIGKPYQGRFGLAYKLYGLDSSNSNAFERYVVLHSHACVPETETDYEICQSDGCPTVSPGFLKQLQVIIDASSRPILLSVYEGQ